MKPFVMLAAVATSALLVVPTVASAQTQVTASVPVNDLNLTVTGGRAKLDNRVSRAIGKLCAEPEMRGADRMSMENYCVASAKVSGSNIQFASTAKRLPSRG